MHKCKYMASSIINNIDDYLASDGLIYFDKTNNAYYVVDGHSGNCIQIEYCPWCGQRLMSIKADDHKNIFTIFEKDAGNYKRRDERLDEDEIEWFNRINRLFEENKGK